MNLLNKKIKTALFAFVIVTMLLAAVYFLTLYPRRGTTRKFDASLPLQGTLSQQEATRDLNYFYNHIRARHPAWLDGSEALVQAVEDQYRSELANLSETITVLELWQAAARMAAKMGDSHTWVRWNNPETPLYIDNFKQISDFGNPVTINGKPTEEILDEYLSMASYELLFYAEAIFSKHVLRTEHMLQYCGIDTSDGVEMSFLTDNGLQTFHYEFVPLKRVIKYKSDIAEELWVEYAIDRENDLGIFTLRSCIDNEGYQSTLQSFFEEVFDNDISNVAVDLRGNGGGNSIVANKFLEYIDVETYRSWSSAVRFGWFLIKNQDVLVNNRKHPETFGGNLFVLTDTFTYSAAMDFAMLIGDNDLGILIGTPSGNLPDAYGDCLYFQMPNSGLAISISHKSWSRIDSTRAGEPVIPDINVPSEEALDKVYEIINN